MNERIHVTALILEIQFLHNVFHFNFLCQLKSKYTSKSSVNSTFLTSLITRLLKAMGNNNTGTVWQAQNKMTITTSSGYCIHESHQVQKPMNNRYQEQEGSQETE